MEKKQIKKKFAELPKQKNKPKKMCFTAMCWELAKVVMSSFEMFGWAIGAIAMFGFGLLVAMETGNLCTREGEEPPTEEDDRKQNTSLRRWKAPDGKMFQLSLECPEVFWIHEVQQFTAYFQREGYVVIRGTASISNCDRLRDRILTVASNYPNAVKNGFLDFYHDDALAQIRQAPAMYKVFCDLLGSKHLWVVFDRVIYQPENDEESELTLLPHVDQNPVTYPNFFGLQGMLALEDMDAGTGVLSVIPKSTQHFSHYLKWVKGTESYIPNQSKTLPCFLGLCVKAGDLIIWDSRTTHSRYRESPEGKRRCAALVSFMKAPVPSADAASSRAVRMQCLKNGTGHNNHAAGLRATASPRFEDSLRIDEEQLTELGEKLYGLQEWEDALCVDDGWEEPLYLDDDK